MVKYNMRKGNLLILVVLLSNLTLFGQNDVAFTKSNFKSKSAEFKIALQQYQVGDLKYFGGNYNDALKQYLLANKFNSSSSNLTAKIGDCYVYLSKLEKGINYLNKAYSLDENLDGYFIYQLARAYHLKNDFDNAIKKYQLSKIKKNKIEPKLINGIDQNIKACNYAKELIKIPLNVKVESLSEAVNSENEEYVPVITADESELFFTSRRSNTTGGNKDEGLDDYYEDIYYSKKENDKWTKAVNLGRPVNGYFHDATVGLSLDGQKLFLYRDNKKGVGNILVSKKEGDQWSEPKELPEPINSKNQETSACYSPSGNTIYFVSNRSGGQGGKDIYKASKNKKGEWGNVMNLGSTVNSVEDEDAIFLHPDGKTLYFSSRGHNTMGGYDVFKTENIKGRWSKPINIGYPINSSADDVCFVLTASGDYGYYTSIKEEGKGKRDIYRVSFLDELNKPKLTLLKGVVSDRKTAEKILATLEIYDNTKDKLVGTFETNSSTGRFMVSLPAGRDYGISVKKEDYLFYSENFNVPDTAAFQVVEKFIKLDKLEVGKKVVLNNIFYDYSKASLRASSFNELSKVVELLKTNPKMKIEFSAHTDSRGGDAYNKNLSQQRAQSCVDYLLNKSIAKDRLVAKGYGEKQLVVTDLKIEQLSTEEEKEVGHQKNRRTEFKILEN
tara:strand:- start:3930 stop:5936 length:2007 start_codon:yes stop_codon:yes gene_type:complete